MSKISKAWRDREAEGLSRREKAVAGSVELSKAEVPGYPPTPVASAALLGASQWLVEEKLDGANCAVWLDPAGAVRIRDRNRALRKGVQAGGWAKRQFAPLWGRAGEAKAGLLAIERSLGFRVALYAEWLLVVHGRRYEAVGDFLRPWGVWSIDHARFVDPVAASAELIAAGFQAPARLGIWTPGLGWGGALAFAAGPSSLGGPREGAVFKRGDGIWQTGLGKLIDPSYGQNSLWDGDDPIFQSK